MCIRDRTKWRHVDECYDDCRNSPDISGNKLFVIRRHVTYARCGDWRMRPTTGNVAYTAVVRRLCAGSARTDLGPAATQRARRNCASAGPARMRRSTRRRLSVSYRFMWLAGAADVGGQQIVALLTRHSRERQHVGRTDGWVGSSLTAAACCMFTVQTALHCTVHAPHGRRYVQMYCGA